MADFGQRSNKKLKIIWGGPQRRKQTRIQNKYQIQPTALMLCKGGTRQRDEGIAKISTQDTESNFLWMPRDHLTKNRQ